MTAPVAWPGVRAYLAQTAPALLGIRVYDGPVVTGEAPSAYLAVASQPSGVAIGDSTGATSAGTFRQEQGPDGYAARETGEVRCELAATRGDARVPDVFALYRRLAQHLHHNQLLGGALQPSAVVTASADVLEDQTTAGGVQRLHVTVEYETLVPYTSPEVVIP